MAAEKGAAAAAAGTEPSAPPAPRPAARGASHSAEIEYAMGNLATNKVFAWTPDDYKVSDVMQAFFANFVKSGNPNGAGLPEWPPVSSTGNAQVMRIDVESGADADPNRARYLFLDALYTNPSK
jgi:para-nitrobenzyl esterase